MIDNEVLLNKFGDLKAIQTDWEPLTNTSTSTPTHKLKIVHKNRILFNPIKSYLTVAAIFSIIGAAISIYAITTFGNNKNAIITLIIGILFFLLSLNIYFTSNKTKFFDKEVGYFWIGKAKSYPDSNSIKLNDIRALQILSKDISSDSWYTSYELNIIDLNSNRFNVLSYGGLEKEFVNECDVLGKFLNVPVWNAINIKNT